jgi:hypothetical protein
LAPELTNRAIHTLSRNPASPSVVRAEACRYLITKQRPLYTAYALRMQPRTRSTGAQKHQPSSHPPEAEPALLRVCATVQITAVLRFASSRRCKWRWGPARRGVRGGQTVSCAKSIALRYGHRGFSVAICCCLAGALGSGAGEIGGVGQKSGSNNIEPRATAFSTSPSDVINPILRKMQGATVRREVSKAPWKGLFRNVGRGGLKCCQLPEPGSDAVGVRPFYLQKHVEVQTDCVGCVCGDPQPVVEIVRRRIAGGSLLAARAIGVMMVKVQKAARRKAQTNPGALPGGDRHQKTDRASSLPLFLRSSRLG